MHFARQLASDEAVWSRLFSVGILLLLPIHRALAGPMQTIPIFRTSGDDTISRIGGISWRGREFTAESPGELIDPFFGSQTAGSYL